jgi:hypothetical protein
MASPEAPGMVWTVSGVVCMLRRPYEINQAPAAITAVK